MNKWIKLVIAASFLLVIAACGSSTDPEDDAPPAANAVVNGTLSVNSADGTAELSVSALDDDGRAIAGNLTDASVTIDDVQTASGDSLSLAQTYTATVSVCQNIVVHGEMTGIISLDASGSMSGTDRNLVRADAAKRFVAGMGPGDELAIASFTTGTRYPAPQYYWLHQDFTTDQDLLNDAIDEGTHASSLTPLWASSTALIEDHLDTGDNKILLVLTDGYNEGVAGDPQTVIDAAEAADVRVYFVGLGSPSNLDEGRMMDVSSETDGMYARADDADAMTQLFANVQQASTASGSVCLTFNQSIPSGTTITGVLSLTVSGRQFDAPFAITFP